MADKDFLPKDLPLAPCAEALQGLGEYLDMLAAWNKSLNLTGFDDRARIMRELIADSFYLAHFMSALFVKGAQPFSADLGAGAGLPGIPLRLVWHAGSYTMVEAREKRALFLINALSRLKLPDTFVFRGKAEKFFQAAGRKMDCIVSRAFMPWPKLGEFCRPHLAKGGFLIVMANEKAPKDPGPWRAAEEYPYASGNRTRWFWALAEKP